MVQWTSLSIAFLAGGVLLVAACTWSICAVCRGEWTNRYKVTVRRQLNPLGFWIPVILLPLALVIAIGFVVTALVTHSDIV
jgi:hypothetical protein